MAEEGEKEEELYEGTRVELATEGTWETEVRVAVLVRLRVVVDVPLVVSSARAAPAARTAKKMLESCILAVGIAAGQENIQRQIMRDPLDVVGFCFVLCV